VSEQLEKAVFVPPSHLYYCIIIDLHYHITIGLPPTVGKGRVRAALLHTHTHTHTQVWTRQLEKAVLVQPSYMELERGISGPNVLLMCF
jgi:hypothetical protein